jgi:5'-phosphate synthase pdxT subunit
MIVGVLALQGDVPEHRRAFADLVGPHSVQLVRTPEDLSSVDALVLPGGESTTIARLMAETGLDRAIAAAGRRGLPILATCAGLILVARELEPGPGGREPATLGLLDVKVRRNDYGGQRESFEAPVDVAGVSGGPFPGVFIRAPRILSLGSHVRPLARLGEQVVGVHAGKVWGLTFHPELSGDPRVFAAFLRDAQGATQASQKTARTATAVRTKPRTAQRR